MSPEIKLTVPSWDPDLEASRRTNTFSIENSRRVPERGRVLRQLGGPGPGLGHLEDLLKGSGARRVFRFWTGDDTDASIVIDDKGYLYVASELEKFNSRSQRSDS